MAFMFVTGSCAGCGQLITFNADRVPSVRLHGVREPLCLACATRINENRKREGMEECPIHPDAYEPQEVE